MKTFASLLLLVAGTSATASPPGAASRLATYYEAQAAEGDLNGNVLVAERGRTVYQHSFGYADFAAHRPNAAATEFEMASVSKVFTGIAVMQLVERGTIGLDHTLTSYMPAFPYRSITVRQLLSHSSGLSEQEISHPGFERSSGRPIEMADLVPAIVSANTPPRLGPGEKWWYSNLGYQLLARLVEERSGQRFDAYIRQHILRPAAMRHTYLRTHTINAVDTPAVARNYDFPFRYSTERVRLAGPTGYYNERLYGPDHVVGTTGDMLLLDRALRDGRLLRPATLALAYSPQTLADGSPVHVWIDIGGMGEADDGLGWFIFRDTADGRIVWHAGGTPGCSTMFMRNIDRDQTVVIFDNTNSENLYRKALAAMRILNGHPPVATPRSLTRIFGRLLATRGEDAAFVALLQHRGDTEHYSLTENDLNTLGYQFADNGKIEQALATFRAGIALWPTSDNLTESYGEGLERAGRHDDALAMFRLALQINPQNADAKTKLAAAGSPR